MLHFEYSKLIVDNNLADTSYNKIFKYLKNKGFHLNLIKKYLIIVL